MNKKIYKDEINFINKFSLIINHSSFVFPYSFVFNYDYNKVEAYLDYQKEMFYVLHNGHRLYFSRDYQTELSVKKRYNAIAIEQDKKSPHRYCDEFCEVEKNDIVVDIGSAEGNFALDVIEKASAIYLFEANIKWIEALRATFEPWKEKVHIINKYVSNKSNERSITLDDYFENADINFIKMDVEGEEHRVLEGAIKIISEKSPLKLSITTYHKKNDAKKILKVLKKNRFSYKFSNGYMLYIYSKLSPPYFRRGIIYAVKN